MTIPRPDKPIWSGDDHGATLHDAGDHLWLDVHPDCYSGFDFTKAEAEELIGALQDWITDYDGGRGAASL